ncbi:hypothetical protein O181_010608 [Austropuccinia psidii MF-1]|uniref:Uncharacterized protein n=1 Tax=Austropuccinia psidii MF-1 TaxID=1389203 RepID=A0A9Q3BTN7_9BASI|nr:hypothetical protein [Austropuccinia psidii MF-1]
MHTCFRKTTSESPLYTHLTHLHPCLISSTDYHAYTTALTSHILTQWFAPAPSPPADHAYACAKDWHAQNHLQTSTVYHPDASTPHLIISAAYHAYPPALPSHVPNFPSLHSCNEWLLHQEMFISPIDHSYAHGNICLYIISIGN